MVQRALPDAEGVGDVIQQRRHDCPGDAGGALPRAPCGHLLVAAPGEVGHAGQRSQREAASESWDGQSQGNSEGQERSDEPSAESRGGGDLSGGRELSGVAWVQRGQAAGCGEYGGDGHGGAERWTYAYCNCPWDKGPYRDGAAPTFFGAYGEWMQTPLPTWEDVAWMREQ